MRRFALASCGGGWFGAIIIAPGMLDGGWPIWTSLLVGAGSLIAAYIGGYYAGLLWDKPARRVDQWSMRR